MIVLVEPSEVLPLVDLEVGIPVGSLRDPIGLEGLAQLTGQLMRRGPKGVSQRRFDDRLASLGARLSIQVSMRSTLVRAIVLRRHVEPLAELLADVVARPALRPTDFSKLKRQAQASLLARLDDDQTLGAVWFRKALFREHPYGRSLNGGPESLRGMRLKHAHAFYERQLRKAPMVVGVSGAVSDADARALIAETFPKARAKKASDSHVPPTRTVRGRHVVIVDKPDRTQTQLFIGTLGARTRDRDLFPLIVSNTAFGGTFRRLCVGPDWLPNKAKPARSPISDSTI